MNFFLFSIVCPNFYLRTRNVSSLRVRLANARPTICGKRLGEAKAHSRG